MASALVYLPNIIGNHDLCVLSDLLQTWRYCSFLFEIVNLFYAFVNSIL